MRIVKDYPPNQLIPAQVECFNYILKHFKKHHGICNGREFYYWDKGWVMYTLEYIKEDVMAHKQKAAVQRQLPTAFVWVQGPRFGSFAGRQKIQ